MPCSADCSRKNSACSRFPSKRPCMSVKAVTTVSIPPCSTSAVNSSIVSNAPSGRPREPALEAPAPSAISVLLASLRRGRRLGPRVLAVLRLDSCQLLFGALHDRAREPLTGREHPPGADEQERSKHRHRRVVEVRPVELVRMPRNARRVGGEDEQD